MRSLLLIITATLMFTSCDCIQQVSGVVVNSKTLKPIANVALGKYEKEDAANSYSKRIYTDNRGRFDYHSTSGGVRNCPDPVLYFTKQGYKRVMLSTTSSKEEDTVYMEKNPFNPDSSMSIALTEFDEKTDSCISWLQTKQLTNMADEDHIEIMMCLNTIFMRQFKGGHYEQLVKVSEEKKYTDSIIKIYPKWIPNRGMGFYFPKLNMELYGTPSPYAIYNVTK